MSTRRGAPTGRGDERHGIVWLAEISAFAGVPAHFSGIWGDESPPRHYEDGPDWPDAESALAWGRERARVVLIHRAEGQYFSAGDDDPRGDGDWKRWAG
jgi:hypothetical protein